jgi:hypothetical protein
MIESNHFELIQKILFNPEKLNVNSLEQVNWQEFIICLRQHNLLSLVYKELVSLKKFAIPESLNSAAQASAIFKHLLQQATLQIVRELNQRDVSVLILKGFLLSELLYQDVLLRDSGDIDLLVPANRLQAALQVLSDLGYRPVLNILPVAMSYDQKINHAYEYEHSETGLKVDLHWALVERYYAEPAYTEAAWSSAVDQELAGAKFKTLSLEQNYLQVCLQSFKDRWASLGHLLDVYNFERKYKTITSDVKLLSQKLDLELVVAAASKQANLVFECGQPPINQISSEFTVLLSSRNKFANKVRSLIFRYLLPFGPDLCVKSQFQYWLAFIVKPLRVIFRAIVQ